MSNLSCPNCQWQGLEEGYKPLVYFCRQCFKCWQIGLVETNQYKTYPPIHRNLLGSLTDQEAAYLDGLLLWGEGRRS